MSPATDRIEESGLATDVGREIGAMAAIIAAEVARRIIEIGEMIPATRLEDGQMILLT